MSPCDAYYALHSLQPEEQSAELVDAPNVRRQRDDRHIGVLFRHALGNVNALIGNRRGNVPEQAHSIPGPDLNSHGIESLSLAPSDCHEALFLALIQYVRAVPTVNRHSARPRDVSRDFVAVNWATASGD